MKNNDLSTPFKVIVIDKNGSKQILNAQEIVVEINSCKYYIQNINHPVFPNGITVSCSHDDTRSQYFSIFPAAANVITLVINGNKGLSCKNSGEK